MSKQKNKEAEKLAEQVLLNMLSTPPPKPKKDKKKPAK